MKRVKVLYFGLLAERRDEPEERVETESATAAELYRELDGRHGLGLAISNFRVAVNDEFAGWEDEIACGDTVAFLPPVSGG